MRRFQNFVFRSYTFDASSKQLVLNYGFDDELTFSETYFFDFDFVNYSRSQLERAIEQLFFMAGVSYFKAYVSDAIHVQQGQLDASSADFFARTYQRGLGEFFYVNQLDPQTAIPFKAAAAELAPEADEIENGYLVGIGGGKDSLVTIEMLRQLPRVATWSVGHKAQLEPLIEQIGLPHFYIERRIDPQLIAENEAGARNGHVPISAILASVSSVVAILTGYSSVVVSNENSANEHTLEYNGVSINHQYSKSLEFEQDFQEHLHHHFAGSLQYFSFLRPLSELFIAEIFSSSSFDKYSSTFSSCNRAFIQGSTRMSWCGECSKCAFVFLALTPFVERNKLEQLWGGKNLLLSSDLSNTYRQLLGISGDKPLDCVGEIKESRAAMRLALQIYPELDSYEFELPSDYDYRALAAHSMPQDLYDLLLNAVASSSNNIVEERADR